MSDKQLAVQQQPNMALMLQTFIDKGVTAENVSALGMLCELQQKLEESAAKREFAAAFVALQGEMPAVKATKAVNNKDGTVRYKFAPYEDIMKQAQPFLKQHKFTVTFDNKMDEQRVVAICTLMHASGHSRENSFACRIGSGPPGSSDQQADGSASSYAKRLALCNALNIIVEHIDDDARLLGAPVDEVTAKALKDRVAYLKMDEATFLKLAGAAEYAAIPDAKYDLLDGLLFEKEVAAGVRNKKGDWL